MCSNPSAHQFAEMTSIDLDHLSSEAQTGHVVLKVQLHSGQLRGRNGQTDGVAVDQTLLLLRRRTRLCAHTHTHTYTPCEKRKAASAAAGAASMHAWPHLWAGPAAGSGGSV